MAINKNKTEKCPYCKSRDTAWKGYRVRVHDKVRLKRCRKCGRKFTSSETISLKGRPRRKSK